MQPFERAPSYAETGSANIGCECEMEYEMKVYIYQYFSADITIA
jgi:hypothetical protein